MPATSPVKISSETDKLLTEAAHFLARSKKDIVDAAVRDYVDAKREEINAGIKESLARIDGSRTSVVAEITGFSREELEDLGGVPED